MPTVDLYDNEMAQQLAENVKVIRPSRQSARGSTVVIESMKCIVLTKRETVVVEDVVRTFLTGTCLIQPIQNDLAKNDIIERSDGTTFVIVDIRRPIDGFQSLPITSEPDNLN